MKRYSKIIQQSERSFKRQTGLSIDNFNQLLQQLGLHIAQLKIENPLKNRGLKGGLSLEDKLLLTLYYIRHYPIFLLLGQIFNISESYAHKIYHRIIDMIVKIAHVKGVKSLVNGTIKDIVVDVSEQPIERPKKGQKKYYSGKKNDTL